MNRRVFMKTAGAAAAAGEAVSLTSGCGRSSTVSRNVRPNVILIMTDDQGYGDIGRHGNEHIRTPTIDRFAGESAEFTCFHVCPTCAPTRAGLLTGRYHHRTGVQGVMSGEALIHPDEVTMAEIFRDAGYRTGIFGKWHLGDNYPRRPIDQGFEESLVHNGGGLSQPSCPPGRGYFDPAHQRKYGYVLPKRIPHWLGSNNYFDPILRHNGVYEQCEGYCTDIFFGAAMSFIGEHRSEPFLVYLPTNAPHAPEIIGENYLEPYRALGLDDTTARCYAMITNIDDNIGRLLARLSELGLADNTIVIFLGDNGPQYLRYNAGLRDRKGSFYEGGICVPFFICMPGASMQGKSIETIAANIDVLPTLLDICGIEKPADVSLDGHSLIPLLSGNSSGWPDRTLFFQGNNGVPERYNRCAVMTQRYKLVDGVELYDLAEDPSESHDCADDHPDTVSQLRSRYESWFDDVVNTRGQEPQRLYIGTSHENPVTLTPQDWRGERSRFVQENSIGYWLVDVRTAGRYEVGLRFKPTGRSCTARFTLGGISASLPLSGGETAVTFEPVAVGTGENRLDAWLDVDGVAVGVSYVDVKLV